MYEIGELVVYGFQGVCKVDKIGTSDVPGLPKDKLYYTLTPLYGSGTISIPVDTKNFMRPVISKKEADEVIMQISQTEPEIYEDSNYKVIEQKYKNKLASHDCRDLMYVIKSVKKKGRLAAMNGKNLGHTDEKYMKMAENLLDGEFAIALDIDRSEVPGYIQKKLQQ